MKKTILLSLWLAGAGFVGCASGMERPTSCTNEATENARYIVPTVSYVDVENFDANDPAQVQEICSQVSSRLILLYSWRTGNWNSTNHSGAELLGCAGGVNDDLPFWREECQKELSKFTKNISDNNDWLIRDGKIDLECVDKNNLNRDVELASGEKTTLLDLAISTKVEKVLRYLIFKSSYDINTVDSNGHTLLDKLLRKGSEFDDLIIGLIEQGGVFNTDSIVSERDCKEILFSAIRFGCCKKAISKLLDPVTDVNGEVYEDETLLTAASTSGNKDVVLALLQKGANPREANSDGDQPIHVAADYNHMDIVKLLISNGVSINDRNASGDQPLHIAIGNKYREMALEMIEMGADVLAKGKYDRTPIQCVATKCCVLLLRSDSDFLLKIYARDYLEIYDALIRKGAVLNISKFEKERVNMLIKLVNE